MKSNEDYLDELLKSMGEDSSEESDFTSFGTQSKTVTPLEELSTGKMDQSMIDALLAGAEITADDGVTEEVFIEEAQLFDSPEDFEKALMAELEAENNAKMENIDDIENFDNIEDFDNMADIGSMEDMNHLDGIEHSDDTDTSSMLAQLMAEMQAEAQDDEVQSFDDDLITEESIEALLSAAKNSAADIYEEQTLSFDMADDDSVAEIESLLGMSETGELVEENSDLLRKLEEAEASAQIDSDEVLEVNEAELDAILSMESSGEKADVSAENNKKKSKKIKKERVKKEKVKKEKADKEKKSFNMKEFFGKIFSALMEEVPDEDSETENGLKLSDENQAILNELEQEGTKKGKLFGKKEKKEKTEKTEKPKKERSKKEKKPKKDKKPKKEKKPKAPKVKNNAAPERKIPRKKKIVTFIFAFSVLALILLLEFVAAPMLTQSRARSFYDKGNYYEAYKEYYGQKLSEEDEKRFQSATIILRMQSNLDGYNNYIKMNKELKALHCLMEGVRVKFDVYMEAEELGVISQVATVYQQILDILDSKYNVSEEAAMDIVDEASDAVYTRKLEAILEGKTYSGENGTQMNQSDMLPEEEALFQN